MGRKNPLRLLVGPAKAKRAHVIGRTALLDLLIRDAAVVAAFDAACGAVTGLAMQLGAFGERIAHRAGLPGRAHLFDPNAPQVPVLPEYQSLNATYVRVRSAARPVLEQHLKALVFDTWQLEWSWLVFELDQHYDRLLNSLITGDGWSGSFSVPPLTLHPGESGTSYLQRVQAARGTERTRGQSTTRRSAQPF